MQEFILKNLLTIVFVIILIYGFVRGFAQGFLKKILTFGSLIFTIIATKYLTPIVSNIVKDFSNIEATLSDLVYNALIKTTAYDKFNLGAFEKIYNTTDLNTTIKNTLCTNIANALINLMCGIVVFILVLIITKIILKALDIVDYIPVLGQLNKMLGGVLGIVEVIVIAWSIFTVLKVLENVPQVAVVIENIKSSALVGTIYDNNPVYEFLSNLFSIFKKQ